MKTIPGELQHALVIADIDKKEIRTVVRKTCVERRKITLLKDVKIWKRFEDKVIKLVDVGVPILWGHFMDRFLKACDGVCGKKRGRRSKGNTWWWNIGVKDVVSREKDAHKVMCRNSTEENRRWCESVKKKVVSKERSFKSNERRLKRCLLNYKITLMGTSKKIED